MEQLRQFANVNVNLEGIVELNGREVWKATLAGNPINIIYSRKWELLLNLHENAPENANAYSTSKPLRKGKEYTRAIQYYQLHTFPNCPGGPE